MEGIRELIDKYGAIRLMLKETYDTDPNYENMISLITTYENVITDLRVLVEEEEQAPYEPPADLESHVLSFFGVGDRDSDDPLRNLQHPRNWTKDYERSMYECRCSVCKGNFFGDKRRVICRVCYYSAVKQKNN